MDRFLRDVLGMQCREVPPCLLRPLLLKTDVSASKTRLKTAEETDSGRRGGLAKFLSEEEGSPRDIGSLRLASPRGAAATGAVLSQATPRESTVESPESEVPQEAVSAKEGTVEDEINDSSPVDDLESPQERSVCKESDSVKSEEIPESVEELVESPGPTESSKEAPELVEECEQIAEDLAKGVEASNDPEIPLVAPPLPLRESIPDSLDEEVEIEEEIAVTNEEAGAPDLTPLDTEEQELKPVKAEAPVPVEGVVGESPKEGDETATESPKEGDETVTESPEHGQVDEGLSKEDTEEVNTGAREAPVTAVLASPPVSDDSEIPEEIEIPPTNILHMPRPSVAGSAQSNPAAGGDSQEPLPERKSEKGVTSQKALKASLKKKKSQKRRQVYLQHAESLKSLLQSYHPLEGTAKDSKTDAEAAEKLQKIAQALKDNVQQIYDQPPTPEETHAFAQYLGMDVEADRELLYVAEWAMTAPLPADWSVHLDSAGNEYFYNPMSKISQYEHPMDATYRQLYHSLKQLQHQG